MATNSPSQQQPAQDTLRDDIPVEVEGFSEEERREIVAQIDQVATGNRLGTSEAFTKFEPEKKGSLFPLVVNILAVLLIAAGVFGTNYYFSQRIEELSVKSTQIESAEGKILEEVKKESEQKLKAKESEISKIREDLQQIEQERQTLQENMQAEIEAKEQELQEELRAALSSERRRLESEGVSSEEMQNRLEQFRAQQEERYSAALQEYRSKTMQQLEEKEQELQEAKATAEQILAEANREKEEILKETQEREEELRQQFETERERLTAETSEAKEELEQLSEIRQNEQLYRDQINGMYREIQTALEGGDRHTALTKIADMREFLQNVAINEAPSIAKRRDIDQFFLGLLEDQSTKTGTSSPDESLLEAAKTISSLRSTVEEAQKLQQEGKLYEAKRYFNRATELIPSVSTAVTQLEKINRQESGERIRELLSAADTSVEEGELEQAAEQFTAAITEAAPVHTAAARSAVEGLLQIFETRLERAKADYDTAEAELLTEQRQLQSQLDLLKEERKALQETLLQSDKTSDQLNDEIDRKDTRISELQETLKQKETQIDTLNRRVTRLEKEQQQLTQRYRKAQEELDDAVDQMAELVSRGESNSRLREAVQRYEQFKQRSSTLLTSPNSQNMAAAQAEFERFVTSEEIKSLFPELSSLYTRLDQGTP